VDQIRATVLPVPPANAVVTRVDTFLTNFHLGIEDLTRGTVSDSDRFL
jgi:hypothetical protein